MRVKLPYSFLSNFNFLQSQLLLFLLILSLLTIFLLNANIPVLLYSSERWRKMRAKDQEAERSERVPDLQWWQLRQWAVRERTLVTLGSGFYTPGQGSTALSPPLPPPHSSPLFPTPALGQPALPHPHPTPCFPAWSVPLVLRLLPDKVPDNGGPRVSCCRYRTTSSPRL